MGSSATYHSVGFCRLSLLSFALSLPHVDWTAAVTVAIVATAVDWPAAAATCGVRQESSGEYVCASFKRLSLLREVLNGYQKDS